MFFVFLHFFLSFLVRNSSVSSSDSRERLPPLEIWGLIDGVFAWKRGCLRNIVSNLWYIARIFQSWSTQLVMKNWSGDVSLQKWRNILNENIKSRKVIQISSECTVQFRKWAPGLIFFKRPFWGAYFWRGLYSEGLIYGGKFACQNRLGWPYS